MFVVLMYVSFSVTTGRRVCADTARPLRRGPPTERGRSVALYRCGCRRRGPPAPGPACRQRGGFLSAVPCPFFRPHPPALSVPCRASSCFRYRPFFGGRRTPPLFVLSFGLSRPGKRLPAVPFVLALPPCPTRSVFRRALFHFRYRLFLPYRAHPPDQCFRSVSFRRPLAVEDSDHCAKQVCAMLGIL